MKTTKTQIQKIWVLLFLCLFSISAVATQWEVAVVIAGGQEPEQFQLDVDKNIIEMAKLKPGDNLKLSIFRVFKDRGYWIQPDPTMPLDMEKPLMWDFMFKEVPRNPTLPEVIYSFPITGEHRIFKRDQSETSIFHSSELKGFFQQAFSDHESKEFKDSKRLLVLYGHGHGFDGFEQMKPGGLKPFKEKIESLLTQRPGKKPLDLLWFDSCFMASAEVVSEFEPIAPLIVASQESEFSSGTPFYIFQKLANSPNLSDEALAKDLANMYLESYSYKLEGSQVENMYSSSATVAVIDTAKFTNFLSLVKQWNDKLEPWNESVRNILGDKLKDFHMADRADLVDFGHFFLKATQTEWAKPAADLGEKIRKTLEVEAQHNLNQNPRIVIRPGIEGKETAITFGYQYWWKGFEGEFGDSDKIPTELWQEHCDARDCFYVEWEWLKGKRQKKWPVLRFNKSLHVSPFTVGWNKFGYYQVARGELLGKYVGYERTSDIFSFATQQNDNPIRFVGYTYGIGNKAKRYTGLNFSDPSLRRKISKHSKYKQLKFFDLIDLDNL